MKKIAFFFLVLFVGFLATPSIVTYIDENADISMAFTANEEENSSKTQPVSEYTFHETPTGNLSLHFLQEQSALIHYYNQATRLIFLDVLSPPPKQA